MFEEVTGIGGDFAASSSQCSQYISYTLKRAQQILRNRMDESLVGIGLTTSQYTALAVLEEGPGISNAELARRSFVTAQTMHRIMTHLLSTGLVKRQPHPTHGRILQMRLTPRGRRKVSLGHKIATEVEERMFGTLETQQRNWLRGVLERCAQSLEMEPYRTSPVTDLKTKVGWASVAE